MSDYLELRIRAVKVFGFASDEFENVAVFVAAGDGVSLMMPRFSGHQANK